MGTFGLALRGVGSTGSRKPGRNQELLAFGMLAPPAYVAAGTGGVGVRGWGLGGWGHGIGGDGEAARLSIRLIDNSFGILWKVAVGEQGGGFGRAINGNPMHQTLNKAGIPVLVQEPKADLGVVHECITISLGLLRGNPGGW